MTAGNEHCPLCDASVPHGTCPRVKSGTAPPNEEHQHDIECAICRWDGTVYKQRDGSWLCGDCERAEEAMDA